MVMVEAFRFTLRITSSIAPERHPRAFSSFR